MAYTKELELSQIGRIEKGTINTSISNIGFIGVALGIEPKEFFEF